MTSAAPPVGVVGNGYLHRFAASPAFPDTTYSVTAGSLPPGLVLTPTGFLTGAPLFAGTFGPTTVCSRSLLAPPACQPFTIVVMKRMPSILAAPSPGGPVGTVVRETAVVVGAVAPTGFVAFRLFGDAACQVEAFTSTNAVTLAASATSDDFKPTLPGTYWWTVAYSGDRNNAPAHTPCDASNSVTITGIAPTSTTTSTTTTTTSSTVPTTTTTTSTTSTTSTTVPPTTTTSSTSTTSTTSTTAPPTTTSTTTTTLPPTSTTSTSTTSTTVPPTTTSTTTTTLPPTSTSTTSTTSTTVPPTTSTTSTTLPPTTTSTTSTTSTTAPPATTTTRPRNGPPTIQVTPAEAAPGDQVTISGHRYPARSEVRAELVGGSVLLGTTRTDASGAFGMVVTVPAGTSPGLHTIRVRARVGSARAETSILIQPGPPPTFVESVGEVAGSLLRVFG